jgi:peptidoglycan L-alanyl-D-glutamate endopeptidase CwlK
MASRSLQDLSLTMRACAQAFLHACSIDPWLVAQGINILVICTARSNAEQEELYAQGRTRPGKIVTRARGGQSKHNVLGADGQPAAEALDIVPLRHGKPLWGTAGDGIDDDPSDDERDDLEAWQRIGELGRQAGLKWYGTPGSSFREFPHFQNPAA